MASGLAVCAFDLAAAASAYPATASVAVLAAEGMRVCFMHNLEWPDQGFRKVRAAIIVCTQRQPRCRLGWDERLKKRLEGYLLRLQQAQPASFGPR